ncbi:MAG: hypothetical protein ICV68_02485 [Pyrinomonadaceae bacterium]|nr:hypothetical protein [Pyrinomonadaceae bacterium]
MNKTGQDFDRHELEPKGRPLALTIGIGFLLLALISALSYFLFFRRTAQPLASQQQEQAPPPAASTEAQIFENEPVLKDSQAVISGTVRNISRESLNTLSLELELKRRSDGSIETRTISVEPSKLAPGEEGKYSFVLPRQEFSGTQIKHLKSATRSSFIAFKTAPGARRPRELPNEPPTRTVNVPRPSPRSNGEEFINTPDAPTRVP